MIFKGFKFGMLLQLAVGPICLLVFNTSTKHGFIMALPLVLAVALVDGLYIALSGLGVAAIINKEKIRAAFKITGCIILVLFGVNTIFEVFSFTLLPDLKLFSNVTSQNIFIQGLLLTASNPLTIIFWSGVFSTQVAEHGLNGNGLLLFGLGCVLSTLLFLTLVAFFGNILNGFLPTTIIRILNVAVGAVLIYFGIKLLFKK